ncbi:pirin family protein [Aquabacterium sp. A08]|uniref:pirin family protein n=1 Tax=Aquabacterium sp. A08 TaxID=2718532 RepID=UPI00141EC56E|nr:pirin family protein [Aquabacterium sp. A08]NIC41331.1 pirin family protein [Aquabacterium sp. A08]NIC41364.1 pirin family protein [Aquabacterium sp. A08]
MPTAAPMTETVAHPRRVESLVAGLPTSDGAGVKLTRVLTQDLQRRLDPFLMLDAFGSDRPDDYIAGFPDHPHRGFETVTYMIAGRLLHRDSAGHEGLLDSGGVQWMTAGRGVVHSEIPQQEAGVMEGFQLWLNLPGRDKLCPPGYRDFSAAELPRFVTPEGVAVAVIAGASHGVAGAVTRDATAPLYLDLHLPPGSRFAQALPPGHNAFVYVYRGAVRVGEQHVPAQRMAVLANDPQADGIVLDAPTGARALLIAGRPLNEPIVQHGPFVMNTEADIHQAIRDFRAGRLG